MRPLKGWIRKMLLGLSACVLLLVTLWIGYTALYEEAGSTTLHRACHNR